MIEILERTADTIYEDGKYYKTNRERFEKTGYVFKCVIHEDNEVELKLVRNPNQ